MTITGFYAIFQCSFQLNRKERVMQINGTYSEQKASVKEVVWKALCFLGRLIVLLGKRIKQAYINYYELDKEAVLPFDKLPKNLAEDTYYLRGQADSVQSIAIINLFYIAIYSFMLGCCFLNLESVGNFGIGALALGVILQYPGFRVVGRRTIKWIWWWMWNSQDREVKVMFESYKYFYVDIDGVHFTNHREFLFPIHLIFPTYQGYETFMAPKIEWDNVMHRCNFYIRFFWPYIFHPMQLVFLNYRTAANLAGLKPGMRVLEIACGAFPHFNCWKKLVGKTGQVVAFDNNKYAVGDSRRWEWLLGFFNKKKKAALMSANLCSMPFANESFDSVIAIRSYDLDLERIYQILIPGGKLVACPNTQVPRFPKSLEQAFHRGDETDSWRIFTKVK